MNAKKVKPLRRKAEEMMVKYVTTRVLPEDMLTEDMTSDVLINALPKTTHFRKGGFTLINGVGTQKWFYKTAKNNPAWEWEDYLKRITNT